MQKITYLGKRIDGKYERRSWLKRTWCLFLYRLQRTLRIAGILVVVAWFGLGCLKFGIAYAHGTEISYIAPVAFAQTVTTQPDFPILDKIAKAESQDRQFGSNGQVLVNVNTNGTFDIGYYQINSIWGKTAAKMGYNLAVEADNKAFAVWLFENHGSEPWNSSKAVWNK